MNQSIQHLKSRSTKDDIHKPVINKNDAGKLKESKTEPLSLEISSDCCLEHTSNVFAVKGLKDEDLFVHSFHPQREILQIKKDSFQEGVDLDKTPSDLHRVEDILYSTCEVRGDSCCFVEPRNQSNFTTCAPAMSRKLLREMRRDDIKRKISNKPLKLKKSDALSARNNIYAKLGIPGPKSPTFCTPPIEKEMNLKTKVYEITKCVLFMHKSKMGFNENLIKLNAERIYLCERILLGYERLMETSKAMGWAMHQIPKSAKDDVKSPAGREESTCSNGRLEDEDLSRFMNSKTTNRKLSRQPTLLLSSIEADIRVEVDAMLFDRRRRLMKQTEEAMDEFDESLFAHRLKYFQVSHQLLTGGLQLTTMLQELQYLDSIEQMGCDLASKRYYLLAKGQKLSNSSIAKKIRLNEKKAQLDLWIEKENALLKEFNQCCPLSHPHYLGLLQIFSRRERLYVDNEDSCFEDDSDDEGDSCPDGCTNAEYESVLDLRQRRILMEKELKVFQCELSCMKRNYDQFCSDERWAQREMHEADHRIQIFQNEKKQNLNDIVSFMPITSRQIYLRKMRNRTTCSGEASVLVSKRRLRNIYEQTHILRNIIVVDRSRLKDINDNRKQMKREWKEHTHSISRLQKQCEELQMLKLGRMVNIEAFDDFITEVDYVPMSNTINERNEYVQDQERKYEQEARQFRGRIADLKLELNLATEENTKILEEITDLHQAQITMGSETNRKIMEVGISNAEKVKAENKQIKDMKKIICQQHAEIVRLNTQVCKLRRKEGRIYAQS